MGKDINISTYPIEASSSILQCVSSLKNIFAVTKIFVLFPKKMITSKMLIPLDS